MIHRTEIAPGIIRIRMTAEDAASFSPVPFAKEGRTFLTLTGFSAESRPVYRLSEKGSIGTVRKTANGDVTSFSETEKRLIRQSHSFTLRFACSKGEVLTGLGQHEDGIFDYAGRTERLYQHNMKISVPFLLSSGGWGLYLEAGCAMRFEGEEGGFVFRLDAAEAVSFAVIRGKDCAEVLKGLASLMGRPALLPRWAYGYIQSRERYQSARELTDTAAEFRRRGLGLDCIVLDWCSWKDGCWGDKTPDPARFPDVRALTDELHALHCHLMVSVWPNTEGGQDCREFEDAGAFLPSSRIYNAFSPAARDLYWEQCRRHWIAGGADALWCDSCEPITDPDWCGNDRREEDERMRLITEASALRMDPETMNDYGQIHLQGIYEHWRQADPDRRPVLLSRSGGPASASCGAILWSGDVSARWDVLQKQVTEGIKAACSGITWWTLDIGGFFVDRKEPWFWQGDYPDGVRDPAYRELYIRWFQFGCMLPVFRSHGTDTPREPWQFGDENSLEYKCLRDIIALRYRLLPYLYSSAAQTCREGLPLLRAMMTAFPECPDLFPVHDQYMLGDSLLVSPVTRPMEEGGNETAVRLPRGGWFEWFTRRYHEGGRTIRLSTPLERFPLLVRAGSILPAAENARCADDVPLPARELLVFAGADGETAWYDDAGDGYGQGILIPVRYRDRDHTLILGPVDGSLPEIIRLTLRLILPDGTEAKSEAHYTGAETRILLFRDGPEKTDTKADSGEVIA